ncbi:RagB/SusD family nutrient uptake outer membrane protein [Carboxylicivirga sp. N1Y90]|uniref:RagB/SusD family nutrient uptake outer membrane protein n=1 Tax=Carboxylicivirga fragile TaxID=3417571 RepID=UPI003D33C21D|nr:RagB/SusD family nutrient uptake outer membrane protein [Marinilabiliaceae bacterium N1Y90]
MKTINKNILFFIMFASIVLGGTACEDFLTVKPKSSWVTESFYESKSDVKLGLAGIYSYLGNRGELYGQMIPAKFEGGTDEMLYNRTNTKWAQALYMHSSATSDLKNVWLQLYKGIDAANVFISKVPDTPGLTDEERAQFMGEAHFMRALYYLDLVRWWGPVPLRITPTEDINANNLAASSREDVYAQIIKDLEFAAANLKHSKDMEENGHANKMAAHGLLARVYLTMAGQPLNQTDKYAKAIEHCDVILNDGWHQLNGSYKEHFLSYIQNGYDPQESLFEVEFGMLREQGIREDGRIGQINGIRFSYFPKGGGTPHCYAMMQVGVKLINAYEDADERKDWNVANFQCTGKLGKIATTSNQLAQWPGKFRRWDMISTGNVVGGDGEYVVLEDVGIPDKNFTGINYPILRFADVLLMKAEAENEVNGPSAAISYLDMVRVRAGIGTIDPSLVSDKTAFLKEIQNERSRELCFEGLRKHDLIRWGILGETLDELAVMIDASNGNVKQKATFKRAGENFDPAKHTVLPYPLQETTMNALLEQHAEWQN